MGDHTQEAGYDQLNFQSGVCCMTVLPGELRAYLACHPRLVLDQDFTEARLFALTVTGSFFYAMLEPIFYIMTVESSMIHKCALLTGSPLLVSLIFGFTAVSLLPQIVVLLFFPHLRTAKLPRRMAAAAAVIAAVMWGLLGTLARPLDAGMLHWIYWANTLGYMIIGGMYAFSLNTQLLNETKSSTR